MTENVIDRAVFDSLKDSVGDDFISELVETFGEEAPLMIDNLRQALSVHDVDTFRREAHSMKTNAATFGATSLAESAKMLEQLARENQLDRVGNQLELFESLYQEAYKALEILSNDK